MANEEEKERPFWTIRIFESYDDAREYFQGNYPF